jgi:hypothetical protein
MAVTLYLRSKAVTIGMPYGATHLGLIGAAKAVARLGLMLVKPVLPVDPSIVLGRDNPALTGFDWTCLILVGSFLSAVALGISRQADEPAERPNIVPPLLAYFAAALPACILAMPFLTPENGRFMYLPSAFSAILLAMIVMPWMHTRAFQKAAGVVVLLLFGFTYQEGTLYRQSAAVCQADVEWLRTHRPEGGGTVFLVPDSLGGRYMWRNGFETAVEEFAPQWLGSPCVDAIYLRPPDLSSGTLDLGSDAFSAVSKFGSGSGAGRTVVLFDQQGGVHEFGGIRVVMPK